MGLVYRKRDLSVKSLTRVYKEGYKIFGHTNGWFFLIKDLPERRPLYCRGHSLREKDLVEIPLPPSFVGT